MKMRSWAECGPVDMSGRELTEIGAQATASRGDAKLALVIPDADPLRLPAWGFTFRIENQRRLAFAAARCPKAAIGAAIVAVTLLSPAMRGA
jgi:hypothetical protein